MLHRLGQANLNRIRLLPISLLIALSGAFVTQPQPLAHEVQLSNEVGGTLHIEPNDNPKAGTASLTWIALTRRGGQPIPLADCSCKLSVYAQPYSAGDAPIQQPTLSATSAEGRAGIPSATITFPLAGAYELVLQGSPTAAGAFSPFELRFAVTVAQ